MRTLAKTAVVLVPIVLLVLLLRACREGEADRWLARVRPHDPELLVAVDRPGLVVLAPDARAGRRTGTAVRTFADALVTGYPDLVGEGGRQRVVVVLFSSVARLQAFHGRGRMIDVGETVRPEGFTDPARGAVFLPPESGEAVLRHETLHLVMAQSAGDLVEHSPWLKEGLAQLFERWNPRETDGPPALPPGAKGWLLAVVPGSRPDPDRLMAIADYAEFTGAAAARHYAEALLWTAFLWETAPRSALAAYVEAERRIPSAAARRRAFDDLFPGGPAAREAAFRAWLGSG